MKAFTTITIGVFLLQTPSAQANPVQVRSWRAVPDIANAFLKWIGVGKRFQVKDPYLW